jgi:hypothetical protein
MDRLCRIGQTYLDDTYLEFPLGHRATTQVAFAFDTRTPTKERPISDGNPTYGLWHDTP